MCSFRRTPCGLFRRDARQGRLAHLDRLPPKVLAVQLQQVEGVQECFGLVPPVTEQLEGSQPPFVTAHDFPVDQARPHLEVVHRLDHQWIALRPVIAPAGDQPDAHGVAPVHEPEAIVLDLVNPVGAGRGLVARPRRGATHDCV